MGRNGGHVASFRQADGEMIRVILVNLLLFLSPFIAGYVWNKYIRKRHPDLPVQRRWAMSAAIGALLVIAGLLVWRMAYENSPQGSYVPPQFKDGEVVPGRFE